MCDTRAQLNELRQERDRAEAERQHLRDRLEACRGEYARQVSHMTSLDVGPCAGWSHISPVNISERPSAHCRQMLLFDSNSVLPASLGGSLFARVFLPAGPGKVDKLNSLLIPCKPCSTEGGGPAGAARHVGAPLPPG